MSERSFWANFCTTGGKNGLQTRISGRLARAEPFSTTHNEIINFLELANGKFTMFLSNNFSRGFFKNFKIVPKNKFWNTQIFLIFKTNREIIENFPFFSESSGLFLFFFNFKKSAQLSILPCKKWSKEVLTNSEI